MIIRLTSSSSSVSSGAGVFFLLVALVSSVDAARDRICFSGAGVAGTLGVTAGDFAGCCCAGASMTGCARAAGCAFVIAGEAVALERPGASFETNPGGGGNGAIPTPFLSLAAAAAAADAYLSGSPGVRIGIGAGFMMLAAVFDVPGKGVCSVANTGNGDLSCVEDRRPPAASPDFAFVMVGRGSNSGSSAIDCVSCDETRSASLPRP